VYQTVVYATIWKEGFFVKDSKIGIELRGLNNMIKRYIDKHLNKKVVDQITGTNGWIITYLSHNLDRDVFQKDLEEEFGVTRSTASKVINLMVQKGLVERHSVPYDARLKKLVLTPKASKISELINEDKETIEKLLTKGFSDEELETLQSYIERMKNNLQ
ncbi:MarR family winged helix-turn-helix transcriptional regulator, partial [Clostridium paraputrificum]|uniref:MarR family winged helix-turn-helix transcriptional regulator n=1 Tax=Clostridium paraputrificum TaxID=29363 RepID=UPI002FE45195